MHRSIYSQKQFRAFSQAFHAAYEDHYTLVLTGSTKRLFRSGFVLRKLVKEGVLLSSWWGRKKVYICKRRARKQDEYPLAKIPHGILCTEILVRLYLSKYGVMLSDADFSRKVFIPDGGIRYPDGSELLFELSTKDNFSRKKMMANKVANYQTHPSNSLILFIIDDTREKVADFAHQHLSPIWFCDLESFLKPEYQNQLQTPIYIWGGSGESLPIVPPKEVKNEQQIFSDPLLRASTQHSANDKQASPITPRRRYDQGQCSSRSPGDR